MSVGAGRVEVPPVRRWEMPGGLTVLHVEDHRLPAVAASLQLPGGGALDPTGRAGLASLAAALLGKGTRRWETGALAERIDDLGLSWSTRAGWDRFSLTLAGLAEDLDAILELLGEMALYPTFPAGEIDVMKRRRLSALARSVDDPSTLADWAFAIHLYGDHPYGHPLSGTPRSIEATGPDEIRGLHAAAFLPGAATLAVAGDVAPERLDAGIQAAFAAWDGPSPVLPPSPPAPEADRRRVVLVNREDLSQAQIRWGHAGIRRADPDHDACEIMNWILGGGGFSSRMIQRIRAEKGLTYGVHSMFDARRLAGSFRVSTFTPNESVTEVVTEIDSLVEEYRRQGPTEEEVHAARARFVGGYALQFETAPQVAGHFLDLELYGLPADSLRTYQGRVEALGRDELAVLAERTLDPSRALLVVVGRADLYAGSLGDLGEVTRLDYRDLLDR